MRGAKTIDRKTFALGLLWRIVLFAVLTIGLPLLLFQIGKANDCGAGCQGSGLLYLILIMGMGPLALIVLAISLPSLLVPRFRAIGISPWWTVFVLLLLVSNYQFLAYAVMFVGPALNGRNLGLIHPDYLLETIAILAVMAILPNRDGPVSLRTLGWPAIAALILATVVALGAEVSALDALPGLMLSVLPFRMVLRVLAWPMLIALIALPPVALFALWPRQGQVIDSGPERRPPADPLPLVRLGLIAAGLTLVAIVFGMPEMGAMGLLMLPAILVPIGLPTFAAYGAVVLAVYLMAVRRGPAAYAVLALAMLVAGSYAWPFIAKLQAKAADDDAIAAVAVAPLLPDLPNVVLVDGKGRFQLLQRGDIQMVLELDYSGKIEAYVRGKNGRPDKSSTPPTLMPTRYLHLLSDRGSTFAQDRTRYVWGSPFELRLVEGTSDQLLGVWYEHDLDVPRLPPLLNFSGGWIPQPHISNGQEDQLLKAFLDKTLGPAPLPPKP